MRGERFTVLGSVITAMREWRHWRALPPGARAAARRDRDQGLGEDPGIDRAVWASLNWLTLAQDRSASSDGGVARDFSLAKGWAPSYPETTGYIIPTLLECARTHEPSLEDRTRRMLDWLVSIQFPDGGFQGGGVGESPKIPVTFNTGQILMGLAAGVRHLGDAYREPMRRAATWLATTQDGDGCWRRHPTPFAAPGEKAYETHVSWGLFEAVRVEPNEAWEVAARRNVDWALTKQQPNGWFANNDLSDPRIPFTHTIGYVLRGVVEAFRFTEDERYLESAIRCAEGVLGALEPDGRLPGRLDSAWQGAVPWICLTGTVQITHSWLLLHEATGRPEFLEAARQANAYVRRTVALDGPPETRGGIRGSFPISGHYGAYEYLNWAAKFFIDSNLKERELAG